MQEPEQEAAQEHEQQLQDVRATLNSSTEAPARVLLRSRFPPPLSPPSLPHQGEEFLKLLDALVQGAPLPARNQQEPPHPPPLSAAPPRRLARRHGGCGAGGARGGGGGGAQARVCVERVPRARSGAARRQPPGGGAAAGGAPVFGLRRSESGCVTRGEAGVEGANEGEGRKRWVAQQRQATKKQRATSARENTTAMQQHVTNQS